jgi:conjugative relaxase-like TrwC/TraI family protein
MLNIEVNRSAKGVEQYFDCELAVSDYMMKEPGIWAGQGAERLGLHGPVQRPQFVALLRNENPTTGKRLTARMNTSRKKDDERVSNRQVGYGLVFGVPKSLSIYLAITRDQVVENIARSAVDETMRAMEYEMQCKVRKGGLHEDRRTGELLYSKFFHRDSRPISGLSDPHWHVHCFLHNATFDAVEKRWKAGQFRLLIADKGYFQEYFHTRLAQRLMESGYKLRRTDRGWHQWEMACITEREVELFSKRKELIDTLSEERGSTPQEERQIAHHERDSKTTKLFYGAAEIKNWCPQMGPQRGGFKPGEKWTVSRTNCETVTLDRDGQVRHFKPSAKGKWDVLVPSTVQVSVGDRIRVTAGFREGKNAFKNNDIAEVREVTETELVLHDGRRMRRDGARMDQGVCITSHASQCRTVDQVVVLPDGADAKGWYVSLSRARDSMHVYTRDKAALRQSVMYTGERKSVWELVQVLQRSKPQSRNRIMPDLWATRRAEIVRETEMER